MSKKFTSFLVLAALLLAVPTHAQTVAKKNVAKVERFITHKPLTLDAKNVAKAAEAKAADKTVGIAFRGGKVMAAKSNSLESIIENVQEDKAALEKLMADNFEFIRTAERLSEQYAKSAPQSAGLVASHRAAVLSSARAPQDPTKASITLTTEDVWGDGSGYQLLLDADATAYGTIIPEQGALTATGGASAETYAAFEYKIPENADGALTTTNIVCASSVTIEIPAGSYDWVVANPTPGDRVWVAGNGRADDYVFEAGKSYEFNVRKKGSGDNVVIAIDGVEPEQPKPVVLPEGVESVAYVMTYLDNENKSQTKKVKVAVNGNDVYFQGMSKYLPEAWVKGTKDGNNVTFAAEQLMGEYSTYGESYFFYTGPVTFTYDPDTESYSAEGEMYGVLGGQYYDGRYFNPVLTKDTGEEPVATTGANVDVTPYTNSLGTAAEFADFGVLDVNADGRTWSVNADNGVSQYQYSTANVADDWLISPAIKLEAGKKYRFAIDAYSSATWAERLEVKLGTEAKVSALTQVVLEPTEVKWAKPAQTLENTLVSVAATGYYHFGIHAISDADKFYLYINNFVVEPGVESAAPDAVTDLTVVPTEGVLEATVSFKAPTKTVGGAELTDLTKIDILRDGEVIKSLTEGVTPGAELSYVDNDETLTVGTHVYQVIPYNTTGIGVKSDEISVFLSAIIQVPYTVDFSQANVLETFSVIDANEDGKTWNWTSSYGAYYSYDSKNAADDYIITMPIHLVAGQSYNVFVNANAGSDRYAERMEIKLGKVATVAGLDATILPATVVAGTTAQDFDADFSVTETGEYYVAIHAISDADMMRLCINKLAINKGAEPTAPAAVANFTVTPGAQGALEANVAFTAPATYINGTAGVGTLDVAIYRDGALVNTLENIAYGSAQTWKDTDVENGKTYTYQAIPSNADGKGIKSDKISVFVGTDIPAALEDLTYTDNATSITFGWQKVGNVGANGGYVNPAAVDYNVWSLKVVSSIFGSYLDFDQQLGAVTDADSYDLAFNTEEGDQGYKYYAVQPVNEAGQGGAAATSLLVGASYVLPFVESFEGGAFHYGIWEYTSNAGLLVSQESSDEDGVALALTAMDAAGTVTFNTGKLNIKNAANPTLLIDVKSATVTKLSVVGSVDGAELATIKADAPVTSEYTTIKVPLTSLKNGRYAQVGISADFATPTIEDIDWDTEQYVYTYGDMLIIDNIRIVDLYEYDLSVNVKAPASVQAGKKATVTATVRNEGENAAEGYTVKIKAGDKELLNTTVNDVLQPFKNKEFTAELETSIFDDAADLAITAEVVYENDLNEDNNTADALISVKESTAAAPENFTATDKGNAGVDLAWNAPSNNTSEVTEEFDDEEVFVPFSVGGITKEQHTGAFGDWTLYDGNGTTVYGFQNATFDNSGAVSAWMVFNPESAGESFSKTYSAHSGSQFLWSFCPVYQNEAGSSVTPPADHWLISPELPGDAQTISFYAKQISSVDQSAENFYGYETFEVLASSTDNNPASFTKVTDGSISSDDWAEFTASLPAGTKFFAIRHTSQDIFGLLIDDITYTTAGGGAPVAYNVYYEGEKIATVEGDKTTYTVAAAKLAAGERTFGVSAVYATGAESKPAVAKVTVTTAISEIVANGKAADVYSLDGKLVRSQAKSLNGLKGVYVINGKTVIVK